LRESIFQSSVRLAFVKETERSICRNFSRFSVVKLDTYARTRFFARSSKHTVVRLLCKSFVLIGTPAPGPFIITAFFLARVFFALLFLLPQGNICRGYFTNSWTRSLRKWTRLDLTLRFIVRVFSFRTSRYFNERLKNCSTPVDIKCSVELHKNVIIITLLMDQMYTTDFHL